MVVLALLVLVLAFTMLSRPRRPTPATPAASTPTATGTRLPVTSVKHARVVVLVDNYGSPESPGLWTAWGLSLLVEAGNTTILFDTGPDPEALEHNAKLLGVDLSKVDLVVISHEHYDHVGGLEYVAEACPGARVLVPSGMSEHVKNWVKSLGLTLVEVDETVQVAEGVYVVGELYGPPYEQALAVNIEGLGLLVVVGCSHPGVDRIVAKAVSDIGVEPYMVIGGFHLAGAPRTALEDIVDRLLALGVVRIAPIHCSGDTIRSLIKAERPEHYQEAHVGLTMNLGEQ